MINSVINLKRCLKILAGFTKVLTKYSTEYNNSMFFQFLCQELSMDRKDMMSFFNQLQEKDLISVNYSRIILLQN